MDMKTETLIAAYRDKLDEMDDEELIGQDRVNDLREDAIENRPDSIGEELGFLSNEELLGEDALATIREEAIVVRIDAYMEELGRQGEWPMFMISMLKTFKVGQTADCRVNGT